MIAKIRKTQIMSPMVWVECLDCSKKLVHRSKLANDDFLSIAKKLLEVDVIVFATPVYWYSMSSHMKVFFDRLTELLYAYKSIGKALKGKRTYLISTGGAPHLPEGFEVPFRLTSEYFDMKFVQMIYEQRI